QGRPKREQPAARSAEGSPMSAQGRSQAQTPERSAKVFNVRAGARREAVVSIAAALVASIALAAEPMRLANWFDDPFFKVRDVVADCPTPLGPLPTGEELQTQTHARSERGTRCWLEGRCTRPNSYLYDKDIADAVRKSFAASSAYRTASLWVTVQRRIV